MGTLTCLPEAPHATREQQRRHPRRLVFLLPSLTDLAVLLPVACVLVLLQGPGSLLRDGDTGWHIRTGEWILAHRRVPQQDLFSFTRAGRPWFAWEWLWDVCAALIHGRWGLPGLVYANVVLLCLLSALLYRLVRNACRNDILAFPVTAAAIVASTLHWLARPHLASWLLLALFCHAVQSARRDRWLLFCCLPALSILWTNLHGSFFIAPAMLAGEAGQLLFIERDRRAGIRFAASAGLCALGSLANPYGWNLHRHLAAYLFDSRQLETISEYQPLNFHSPAGTFAECLILLGCLSLPWLVWRRRIFEALWIALWLHLSLRATRNLPMFVILAAPVIAAMIQEVAEIIAASHGRRHLLALCSAIAGAGRDLRVIEALPRLHIVSLGVLVALPLALRSADFDAGHFPVRAAGFLNTASASTILTTDAWGGYMVYRLYPKSGVFIDGRSDFYGAAFDRRYVNLINARYDWQKTIDQWPAKVILLPVGAPLASVLKLSGNWTPAYDDGVAIVFRRTQ